MRAGQLDKYVTLQIRSITRGTSGGSVETWNTLANVWASIEPLEGRELLTAQQLTSELTTRIRIRYLEGISTVERVLYGRRVFEILSIINTETSNRELILNCRELT